MRANGLVLDFVSRGRVFWFSFSKGNQKINAEDMNHMRCSALLFGD